jgi:ABC-type transport system involved in Fe-S cluster assembly fused permease/ATPase subunit
MGNVIRSMDRGIAAAQSTMKYCFLYLLPTLGEAGAVCMIFVLHFQNAQLAIFVLLNLYLYCYVTIKITTWRKKFRTATTKHDNELHDRLTDSLVNYETIKYFTAEEYERKEYRNVVTKFQKMSMATQASLSFLNILQQFIINFTLAGGLILATSRLMKGGDLGQFVAVNAYIVQTFAPLSFLGTIYNMVVNALVDMNSFGQLLAESPDVMDTPGAEVLDINQDAGCPIIEFRGVSFHYRKQPLERSIKDISFSTPRGSTTALVGTTGSGKTTITRLLFRFYDPLSGQVLINGKDARSITQKSLRMAMGFVPQDVVMFNASIEHNIKYGRIDGCSQEQVEIAAKQAQLGEFIDQQPQGYSTMVGERGLKLSGGEKQRLAIARCLLKNPPIVVLDEATSALDSQTEQKIQEALNFLSSARTVVAIAHRLSTIRQYDEVLVLEQGQILQRGSHDKLLAEEGGRYWQMWHRQASGIKDEADGPTQP